MTLRARLAKLEQARPEPFAASGLELELPPELCARIAQAQAVGTCPQSLCDADLLVIVAAYDVARGQE